jgi:hypothetical protein
MLTRRLHRRLRDTQVFRRKGRLHLVFEHVDRTLLEARVKMAAAPAWRGMLPCEPIFSKSHRTARLARRRAHAVAVVHYF